MKHHTHLFQDKDARIRNTKSATDRYTNSPGAAIIERGGEPVLAKGYDTTIVKIDGNDGRTDNLITYAITTEQVDRGNDIMVALGANVRNFRRNSPLLWCHQQDVPNIGRCHVPVYTSKTKQGLPGLLCTTEHHRVTRLSQEIHAMAVAGFLPAGSIGFIPLDWEDESAKSHPGAYPFTDTVRKYTKWELLEFSLCNIPMNPTALIQSDTIRKAIERGVIDSDAELLGYIGENAIDAGDARTIDEVELADGEVFSPPTGTATGNGLYTHTADPTDKDLTPQTPTLDMTIKELADAKGVSEEDAQAILEKAMEALDKDLDTELAEQDLYDECMKIGHALVDVKRRAIQAHVKGDDGPLDQLPMDYAKAGTMIANLIRQLPVDEDYSEEEVRSLLESIEKALNPVETKAGAVLSRKNYKALSDARGNIDSVLSQADKEDDKSAPEAETKSEEPDTPDESSLVLKGDAGSIDVYRAIREFEERFRDTDDDIITIKGMVAEVKALLMGDDAPQPDLDEADEAEAEAVETEAVDVEDLSDWL